MYCDVCVDEVRNGSYPGVISFMKAKMTPQGIGVEKVDIDLCEACQKAAMAFLAHRKTECAAQLNDGIKPTEPNGSGSGDHASGNLEEHAPAADGDSKPAAETGA